MAYEANFTNKQHVADIQEIVDAAAISAALASRVFRAIVAARSLKQWEAIVLRERASHAISITYAASLKS